MRSAPVAFAFRALETKEFCIAIELETQRIACEDKARGMPRSGEYKSNPVEAHPRG